MCLSGWFAFAPVREVSWFGQAADHWVKTKHAKTFRRDPAVRRRKLVRGIRYPSIKRARPLAMAGGQAFQGFSKSVR